MTPSQPVRPLRAPGAQPAAHAGALTPVGGDAPATPRVLSSLSASVSAGTVEVRVRDALTARTAFAFTRAVRDHLTAGARALLLNLEAVKAADTVGLSALLQSAQLAALLGVPASIVASAALHRALFEACLLEELPLRTEAGPEVPVPLAETDWLEAATPFLASTGRLMLRQPTWDELPLFARWANEPLLDQMVGSEFLYRCRHLGPYHPEFVASVLSDATALTLVVQPRGTSVPPVGFVRLYNIRLLERLAFLETAVADLHALRKGWGIEASRLLIACGMDLLGLRRVEAKVYAYNLLSINSLRRNGFRQEGILRRAKTYEGQHWDILVFAILREEMEEQRRREQFPYLGFWGERP